VLKVGAVRCLVEKTRYFFVYTAEILLFFVLCVPQRYFNLQMILSSRVLYSFYVRFQTACATVSENIPVDDASPTSSEGQMVDLVSSPATVDVEASTAHAAADESM
jgi:hypothetical protein